MSDMIEYEEWLLSMGMISTVNHVTDGIYTISDDCVSWVGNDIINELNRLIAEEIEKTKND